MKRQEYENLPRLKNERANFASVIKSIWDNDYPHIYFDESVNKLFYYLKQTFLFFRQ